MLTPVSVFIGVDNQTLIPLDKREQPNYMETHTLIDCGLAEGDAESKRPELPLNLLNHLPSRALVLLLF